MNGNYMVVGHWGELTGQPVVDACVKVEGWDSPLSWLDETGWSMRVLAVSGPEEAKRLALLGVLAEAMS